LSNRPRELLSPPASGGGGRLGFVGAVDGQTQHRRLCVDGPGRLLGCGDGHTEPGTPPGLHWRAMPPAFGGACTSACLPAVFPLARPTSVIVSALWPRARRTRRAAEHEDPMRDTAEVVRRGMLRRGGGGARWAGGGAMLVGKDGVDVLPLP
jgi:hypothetical protein